MAGSSVLALEAPIESEPQPFDDELDLFGLTHTGKVRAENQDQFLVCTVHPQIVLHGTSLSGNDLRPIRGERLAIIMLVADGVGGGPGGREASALATRAATRHLTSALQCYHSAGSSTDEMFTSALREAALDAHEAVLSEAADRPDAGRMATTMTLAIALWPWAYVVQVGDSRCYHLRDGALQQVTRDQTMAQALAEVGALSPSEVRASRLNDILTSALGGTEAMPVVTRMELHRDSVLLLCSDGLTKHVSDTEIGDHLRTMKSSEQACRALIDLALERGGSDNITVLVRRAREPSVHSNGALSRKRRRWSDLAPAGVYGGGRAAS